MKPDRTIAQRGVQLHEQLRAYLLTTMGQESPLAIAVALQYELVSILSTGAQTKEDAHRALDGVRDWAHEQIEAYGIGQPHP